jgi:predicted enzyme related to lactoylglutathione lyase
MEGNMVDVRFARVTLFGPDTKRLAAFYEGVLGFTREYSDGDDIGLRIRTSEGDGSIGLLLHAGESRRVDLGTFSVRRIDETVEHLRHHGVSVLSPPTDTPWGTREASIADPDGNSLLLEAQGD